MCLIPKVANIESEILTTWGKLPEPKEERIVAAAKNMPNHLPVFITLLFLSAIFNLFFM